MSHRIFNFSAGPAMLPTEVLEKSAQALLDYQGKGFGIAEVSHRGSPDLSVWTCIDNPTVDIQLEIVNKIAHKFRRLAKI